MNLKELQQHINTLIEYGHGDAVVVYNTQDGKFEVTDTCTEKGIYWTTNKDGEFERNSAKIFELY